MKTFLLYIYVIAIILIACNQWILYQHSNALAKEMLIQRYEIGVITEQVK